MQKPLIALSIAALLAGCASSAPSGPSVVMVPGANKPLEVFTAEDNECRQYAQKTAGDKSSFSMPAMTIGTSFGSIGGGHGSVSGGGVGVTTSTPGDTSGAENQRNYDIAYQQCMYSKGNQAPQAANTAPPPPPPPPAPAKE
ncbi:MAG: lipoprotein [Gallionellaceae bacterium]|nr:lipoprotein [Gallionellaceae bacterium]